MINKILALALAALLLLYSCAGRRGPVDEDSIEGVVTHRVAEEETWESIAEDYYGDRRRAGNLAVYNGSSLESMPEPGSGIRIPLTGDDMDNIRNDMKAASLYNQGLNLASRGDFTAAVKKFRESLKLDSSLEDASFNLGVTYQRLGLHKNAITVLEDLLVRADRSPEYLYALGNSYFHTGEYGKAEDCFRETLRVDSDHLKALYSLAMVYEKTGQRDKADRTWREYLERDPDSVWGRKAKSRLSSSGEGAGGGN